MRNHSSTVSRTSSLSVNRRPFSAFLSGLNTWKSQGDRSGLYGGVMENFPSEVLQQIFPNWITARWACLEESMARSLSVTSLLFQSTTNCRYRVYTKFLLTYTAICRRNRKVLPLGITALQPQSHFHLGTPYIYRWHLCTESLKVTCVTVIYVRGKCYSQTKTVLKDTKI